MTEFLCCALIPTYNNPDTLRQVVDAARAHLPDVLVVDDGSADAGRSVCQSIAEANLATVVHRPHNGGKGAAVKTGFDVARDLGFTHVFQIDADGQHDLDAMPQFLTTARESPEQAILAFPEYDETAPRGRKIARRITRFWVNLETGGADRVRDAMVGFRVYPLAAVARLRLPSDRMDFDVEIAVRLVWAKVPIVNLPVKVRYLSADEGGTSHFQPMRDNLRLAWLHCRLCTWACSQWFRRKLRLPPLLDSR